MNTYSKSNFACASRIHGNAAKVMPLKKPQFAVTGMNTPNNSKYNIINDTRMKINAGAVAPSYFQAVPINAKQLSKPRATKTAKNVTGTATAVNPGRSYVNFESKIPKITIRNTPYTNGAIQNMAVHKNCRVRRSEPSKAVNVPSSLVSTHPSNLPVQEWSVQRSYPTRTFSKTKRRLRHTFE